MFALQKGNIDLQTLQFSPDMSDLTSALCELIDTFYVSVSNIPRVDASLFMEEEALSIRYVETVKAWDSIVASAKESVRNVVAANSLGLGR